MKKEELAHSNGHEFKTKQQIADEKQIHLHTLVRRLSRAGVKVPKGLVSPEMQRLIDETLGWTNKQG